MNKRKAVDVGQLKLTWGVEYLDLVPSGMRDLLRALFLDIYGLVDEYNRQQMRGHESGYEKYTIPWEEVLCFTRRGDDFSRLVDRLELEFPEQWFGHITWSSDNEFKDFVISSIHEHKFARAKAALSSPLAPRVEWNTDDCMFHLFRNMNAGEIFDTMANFGIVQYCHTHEGYSYTDKIENARNRYEHELVLLLQESALFAEDCCEIVVSFLTLTRWDRHAELHRNGHYKRAPAHGGAGCDPCPYGFSSGLPLVRTFNFSHEEIRRHLAI